MAVVIRAKKLWNMKLVLGLRLKVDLQLSDTVLLNFFMYVHIVMNIFKVKHLANLLKLFYTA